MRNARDLPLLGARKERHLVERAPGVAGPANRSDQHQAAHRPILCARAVDEPAVKAQRAVPNKRGEIINHGPRQRERGG